LAFGNSAYQNISRLDNPRNDAMLMAAAALIARGGCIWRMMKG